MLIKNARVWSEEGAVECDIRISDGKVADVGALQGGGGEVIDAAGLDVLPGLIDFHVHVDDAIGRFNIADTFRSGSYAAVRSGVTTFFTFVTQRGGETLGQALGRQLAKGAGKSYCDFGFHVTPTDLGPGLPADLRDIVAKGIRSLKLYTTYREAGLYADAGRLRRVMELAASLDLLVLVHCEDQGILDGIQADVETLGNPACHSRMRPSKAESVAIDKVLRTAEGAGCRVHIVHVSTERGVLLVDWMREKAGARVSCETAPQYLLLLESKLAEPDGHRWLCTPPLRSEHDRKALDAAVAGGGVDIIATDHCPFLRGDKDTFSDDYRTVPNGLPGIGALFPLMYEFLVRERGRGMQELVTRLSANPARLGGVYPRKGALQPGSDADIVIVDPIGPSRRIISTLADCYDPYEEMGTTLDVRYVFLRGEMVIKNGKLVHPECPIGRLVGVE